jgi:hypothetical protein
MTLQNISVKVDDGPHCATATVDGINIAIHGTHAGMRKLINIVTAAVERSEQHAAERAAIAKLATSAREYVSAVRGTAHGAAAGGDK